MNFYQEITLIEQPITEDIPLYFLWAKLYQQLHIAFAEHANHDQKIPFGISLPEYVYDLNRGHVKLGKKLRVFAKTEAELKALDLHKWLSRLLDYVHLQSIKSVPEKVNGYVRYQRKQVKGANRLQKEIDGYAVEHAKRNNVSMVEALKVYEHMKVREIYLPFIQLLSLTSNQRFKLFIEKHDIEEKITDGLFTTYGLSAGASVPEF